MLGVGQFFPEGSRFDGSVLQTAVTFLVFEASSARTN
jgi:hypothetical protein